MVNIIKIDFKAFRAFLKPLFMALYRVSTQPIKEISFLIKCYNDHETSLLNGSEEPVFLSARTAKPQIAIVATINEEPKLSYIKSLTIRIFEYKDQ